MSNLSSTRVAIVGLGLMGGSLALALRPHVDHLSAVDRDAATLAAALATGLADAATADPATGLRRADLVILATPVRAIMELIGRLPALRPDGCLLLDLGSTKEEICRAMADLPPTFGALGGHPMCGREVSGLAAAVPELYRDTRFILCRTGRTTAAIEEAALDLIELIGARPLYMEPAEHDAVVATVSHLPYLMAALLTQQADAAARDDDHVWAVSASGFRDAVRLAGSDPEMMGDILLTNRAAVRAAVGQYAARLEELEALLDSGDGASLARWLYATQAAYQVYLAREPS